MNPPPLELRLSVRYEVLDTPNLTFSPLGELLEHARDPAHAASLLLRDPDSAETLNVEIVEIIHTDHDRTKGGIFFEGRLRDGQFIQGYVFAQPQDPENSQVLGSAVINL